MAQRHTHVGNESGDGRAGRFISLGLGVTALSAGAPGQQIRFGEPVLYPIEATSQIVTADFNRDAHGDVAVKTTYGVEIYLNDGVGGLSRSRTIPPEGGARQFLFATADMDANGDSDVIWMEFNGLNALLTIWYNDGDGQSGDVVRIPRGYGRGPYELNEIVADLTGDGLPDRVSAVPPDLVILENRGDRSFGHPVPIYQYPDPLLMARASATGDFDGDGDADLCVIYQLIDDNYGIDVKGTQLVVLLNDAGRRLVVSSDLELPWQSDDLIAVDVVTGDFDGDGDLEIVARGEDWNNFALTEILISTNDGSGRFSVATRNRANTTYALESIVADLDADGRLDLALGHSQGVQVLQNDGGLLFSVLDPFNSAGTYPGVAVDLTGDGQPDLALGSSSHLAVLVNDTVLDNPALEHSPLTRGERATLTVRSAGRSERVYFLYSLAGAGNSVGIRQLGGITLDLLDPIQLIGSAVADSNGVAELTITVPPNAPLTTVVMQAVIRRGSGGVDSVKTPFRTARILP